MILDDNELNGDLQHLLEVFSHSVYTFAYPLFHTLYYHGFRINELRGISNWDINAIGNVTAPTSKGSNNRIIVATELHPIVIGDIFNGTSNTFSRSYDSFERMFNANKKRRSYRVKTKSIGTHLFRHNRIKLLNKEGLSISEIKTKMGIVKDETVLGYINSKIYYE